jgi:hypothetical protein
MSKPKSIGGADKVDKSLLDPTGGHMDAPPVFPGWEGLPFKGPVPDIKFTDPEPKQPQVGMKVRVDLFDLSDTKDLKKYREICQMVGNGYAQISKEDLKYDEQKKCWRVFIRWMELFTFDPARGNSHGFSR